MNAVISRLTRTVILAGMIAPLSAQEVGKSGAPVKVDPAPVSRQAGVITSFAPVVEKVAPCVVQISTSKNVKGRRGAQLPPGLDDFRRFFGLPDEDSDQTPDQPKPRGRGGRNGGIHKEALGLGSGVIVSREGHILTSNHVIDGADDMIVTLAGDKKEYVAKKIGTDPGTDLAVLKIDVKDVPAVTFADSDKLRVGDFAIAIGNPFGLRQTVTMGIVSSLGRNDMGIVAYENFIQTDASINPGNSGGALVDIESRLIGINTAIFSRTGTNAGIGFAVPSNLARTIMDSIIKNGRVVRGFLGVGMQAIDDSLASKLKLKGTDGALVNEVDPKSPAAKAGMQAGDVITEINGKKVAGPSDLRLTIGEMMPGTKVELAFERNGERKNAEILLTERPADNKLAMPGDQPESNAPDVLDGVTVADLDPQVRKKFGIAEDAKGVVVTAIEAECSCAAAGLRVGDVIHEIEHSAVKNAEDAVALSEKLKSEKEVLLHVSSRGVSRFVVVKED